MDSEGSRKSIPREYYEALLVAILFVNFAKVFVVQAFKIPTGSMIDNLLIGDHIIVNKYVYGAGGEDFGGKILGFRAIRRGDIVVFRYPGDPTTDFVKRVIGLPGEQLAIRDKKVYVDGRPLDEPWALFLDRAVYPRQPALPEPYRSRDQFGPVTVPAGSYFVMGDNRDRSNDSRYWGPVRRELIKGKAVLVYWSFRGAAAPTEARTRERLRELQEVVVHFFDRTRWDRTFLVIDSKYHYHAEPEEPRRLPLGGPVD